MARKSPLLLLAIVPRALAAILTARGVTLAQAQPQLQSRYVDGALPLADPTSPLWDRATSVEVPLTAQAAVAPTLPKAFIPSVRVRSLNNGQWISFLLEWQDATQDIYTTKTDQFRDAAAIQLPVDTTTPGACMGVRGKPVNLWHWKADWQADVDQGFRDIVDAYPNFWKDIYPFVYGGKPPHRVPTDFANPDARTYLVGWAAGNPLSQPEKASPVEELVALGFGTTTTRTQQGVIGRGVWQDGRWRVVFSRPLATSDAEAVQFAPGGKAYVAFAVWDGANQEVGARKQLSADVTMTIEALKVEAVPTPPPAATPAPPAPPPPPARGLPWWSLVLIGVVIGSFGLGAALVLAYARPKARSR